VVFLTIVQDWGAWDDVPLFHSSQFNKLVAENVAALSDESQLSTKVKDMFEGEAEQKPYAAMDALGASAASSSRIDISSCWQVEKPLFVELKRITSVTSHCAELCFDVLKLRTLTLPPTETNFKLLWVACIGLSKEQIVRQGRLLRLLLEDVPCSVACFSSSIAVWVDPYCGPDSRSKIRDEGFGLM
jgi:hypothetical protein